MKSVVALLVLLVTLNTHAGVEEEIDSVAARLAASTVSDARGDHYFLAKAQAWLDLARDARFQGNYSGIVKQALAESKRLADQLESRQPKVSAIASSLYAGNQIRADLRDKAEQFKAQKDFACAQAITARLEVQWVAANHAHHELGWRYAKPYLQAAERLAMAAQEKIVECSTRAAPVATWKPQSSSVSSNSDAIRFGNSSVEIDDANALILGRVSYGLRVKRDMYVTLIHNPDGAFANARTEAIREYLVETGIGMDRIEIGKDTSLAEGQIQVVATLRDKGLNAVSNHSSAAKE